MRTAMSSLCSLAVLVAVSLGFSVEAVHAQFDDLPVPCTTQREPVSYKHVGSNGGRVSTDYFEIHFSENINYTAEVTLVPDAAFHKVAVEITVYGNETGLPLTVYFNPNMCNPTSGDLYIVPPTKSKRVRVSKQTINGVVWLYAKFKLNDLAPDRTGPEPAGTSSGFVVLSN